MLVESLWGIGDAPQLIWPSRPVAGLLLAAFYFFVLSFALIRSRAALSTITRRQWNWVVALAFAGFLAGQLFPVQLAATNPLAVAGGPAGDGVWFFVLAFIPVMLAAVVLPPGAALLVGLATGAGMALWTTHQVYTPFYVALFGYTAGILRQIPFHARLSRRLRSPLISGLLAQLLIVWLVAWGAFAYVAATYTVTEAAGWALATMNAQAVPLMLQSFIGGLAAWLFARFFLPETETATVIPAGNLRRRLINGYGVLALSAAAGLLMIIFALSVVVSRQLVLEQMAQGAQTVVNLVLRADVDQQVLISNLPLVEDGGTAFLVGPGNEVLAHSNPADPVPVWPPTGGTVKTIASRPGSRVFLVAEDRPEMSLIYAEDNPFQPWTVVVTFPYQSVLAAAATTALPLSGLVLLVLSGLGVYLFTSSRSLTAPISDLVVAAHRLAAGRLDTPIEIQGADEVAALSAALDSARRSMKEQLAELNLQLQASRVVSPGMNIQEGMPGVLAAALQGTNAAGARAVLVNPSGHYPITFADGSLSAAMAEFDRRIAGLVQARPVITLATPNQVRRELGLGDQDPLPIRALVAVAMSSHNRFQGVLWVGHAQAHQPGSAEIEMLSTLAGQAAGLVENARLYANAEGGRRRLAAVLASASDAVIVTDQTERILLINPAMERAFNLKAAQVLGRPVAGVIHDPALRALLMDDQGARSRPKNVEISTGDGRTLYAGAATVFSNDRQVLGRVAVLHDISHLKALDELKSEFVSTVSHDLRNPLTFVRGYLDMLPMVGDINPSQQEYLDKIAIGVKQMSAMIENLLGLGRLEAGLDLIKEEVAAGDLLRKVAGDLADPAAAHGLQLEVISDSELPLVIADEALIHEAIMNLVQNAINYAPHSGRVILRAECERDELVISVQDFGPGIPRPDQVRLFEKFYSSNSGKKNREKGTGLGLAIVKSVVERHGGRVWCDSRPGKGSTFYISLPLK